MGTEGENAAAEGAPDAAAGPAEAGDATAVPPGPPRRPRRPRRRRPPATAAAAETGVATEAAGEAAPQPDAGTRPPRNRPRRNRRGPPRDGERPAGQQPAGEPRDRAPREARGGGPERRDRDRRDGERREGRGRGPGRPGGRGRDAPARKIERKLYNIDAVVDRGFEDVEEEAGTRRVHWTILKRTVADQISRKPMSTTYVLQREGADSEFPSLGAARDAVHKKIVHPEKLTRSKAEYAAEKK